LFEKSGKALFHDCRSSGYVSRERSLRMLDCRFVFCL
jgi:hypothetical protein